MSKNLWPSVEDLRNANYCARRTKAAKHTEFLSAAVATWKESIRVQLQELVKFNSADDELTNEAPHCWGVEYARLATPIVVEFLKGQLPGATVTVLEGDGDHPFIHIDWSGALNP